MKHIGFSGTQLGLTDKQKTALKMLLDQYLLNGYLKFHHGDCIGADADAAEIAKRSGYLLVCHPPKVNAKRAFISSHEMREPKEYLDRNQDIALECDTLILGPKENEEIMRSGTWATYRRAKKLQKPIVVLER